LAFGQNQTASGGSSTATLEDQDMSENESKAGAGKRRAKRFLSPSQKYEIWLE